MRPEWKKKVEEAADRHGIFVRFDGPSLEAVLAFALEVAGDAAQAERLRCARLIDVVPLRSLKFEILEGTLPENVGKTST